jgi:tetratricopeptide (TPR) repeat protein
MVVAFVVVAVCLLKYFRLLNWNPVAVMFAAIFIGVTTSAILGLFIKDNRPKRTFVYRPNALKLLFAVDGVKNADEYAADLRSKLKSDPNDPNAIMDLASWLDWHEQNLQAIPILRAACEENQGNAALINQLAWALVSEINVASSVEVAEAEKWIIKSNGFPENTPWVADTRAWLNYKLGRKQEAFNLIEPHLDLADSVPEIAYHAGVILNSLGEKRKANGYLLRAVANKRPFAGKQKARDLLNSLGGSQ